MITALAAGALWRTERSPGDPSTTARPPSWFRLATMRPTTPTMLVIDPDATHIACKVGGSLTYTCVPPGEV